MDEQPFDSVLLLLLLLHVFSSPLSLPFPSICVLPPLFTVSFHDDGCLIIGLPPNPNSGRRAWLYSVERVAFEF